MENNSKQRELMTDFWNEDIGSATEKLSSFLWDTISYMDYHEDYYRKENDDPEESGSE